MLIRTYFIFFNPLNAGVSWLRLHGSPLCTKVLHFLEGFETFSFSSTTIECFIIFFCFCHKLQKLEFYCRKQMYFCLIVMYPVVGSDKVEKVSVTFRIHILMFFDQCFCIPCIKLSVDRESVKFLFTVKYVNIYLHTFVYGNIL